MDKRSYRQRAEYFKMAVSRRRKKLKALAVEFKGGKCSLCGYSKYIGALEFHHLDGEKKDFGLSMNGITISWERTKAELEKCILVCSNCHRGIHGGFIKPTTL